jgi:HEAT repeat protein
MIALEALCVELTSGDDLRAEVAAVGFPAYGQEGLLCLQSLLKDKSADVRWWAVRALASFEQVEQFLPDLLTALADPDADVRQAAAMALCHHPSPKALDVLIKALADGDTMTSRLASNALAQLGSQATLPLLDVLSNGAASARLEAARALVEIKDPRSIPGLMIAQDTDSALLQYWAGLGLEQMGVGMLYLKPE